jgi:predicted transcriptional regulator
MPTQCPYNQTMRTFNCKLSDREYDALKANAGATGRTMTDVVKEALSQYLVRTPLSRDSVIDAVLNPHIGRVIKLEGTIADLTERIQSLEETRLLGFYAPK